MELCALWCNCAKHDHSQGSLGSTDLWLLYFDTHTILISLTRSDTQRSSSCINFHALLTIHCLAATAILLERVEFCSHLGALHHLCLFLCSNGSLHNRLN